jgi:hypothetical protein
VEGDAPPVPRGFFGWEPEPLFPLAPALLAWIFTASLTVWSAWALSAPGMEDSVLLLYGLWLLTALVWLLRALIALGVLAVKRRRARISWHRFVVQPLLVLLVWGLAATDAPLEARFALARGGLEHDAKAILSGARTPSSIRSSGGYALAHVERDGQVVIFETQYGEGFAYAPKGVPGRLTGPYIGEFHAFHGPWYRWDNPATD